MLRYHGVLAPNGKLRSTIVPKLAAPETPPSVAAPVQLTLLGDGQHAASAEAVGGSVWTGLDVAPPPTRHPWSLLIRHVVSVDMNLCEKCGEGVLVRSDEGGSYSSTECVAMSRQRRSMCASMVISSLQSPRLVQLDRVEGDIE